MADLSLESIEGTIFEDYDTVIFDLDRTIWDCFKPDGTGIGAFMMCAPLKLQSSDTVVDLYGNICKTQAGIRKVLELLDRSNKNLGIVSSGEKRNTPFQAQPSTMLLKKFDLYGYFNHEIVLKEGIDKAQYVKPKGKTLFIDDSQEQVQAVNEKGEVDVVYRTSFQSWEQTLIKKQAQLALQFFHTGAK